MVIGLAHCPKRPQKMASILLVHPKLSLTPWEVTNIYNTIILVEGDFSLWRFDLVVDLLLLYKCIFRVWKTCYSITSIDAMLNILYFNTSNCNTLHYSILHLITFHNSTEINKVYVDLEKLRKRLGAWNVFFSHFKYSFISIYCNVIQCNTMY